MAWSPVPDKGSGDQFTEEMWDDYIKGNADELNPFFTAWTSWTPAVFQNGARTSTNTQSRYLKIGRLVHAYAIVTITQAGSAGNIISCTLPFASAFGSDTPIGSFIYFGAARYVGSALSNSSFGASPGVIFHVHNATNAVGADPNFATANGHTFRFSVTYEASS